MPGMTMPFSTGMMANQGGGGNARRRPQAPYTTNIGGQTYVHRPQNNKPWNPQAGELQTDPGSMVSDDGSVWSPHGGQGQQPNPFAAQPGRNPFDFWSQYEIAKNRAPQPVPRVPGISPEDRTAAESAAFGRAKDRTALATQGLLKSIRNNFSRRGISGSPLAMSQEGGALEAGHGQLADVVREQAIQDLRRREEIQDNNYAGDVTQRGQDISQENARQDMIMRLVRMAFESGGAY